MSTSPERIAIISDVHANLEALTAVLEDIRDRGVRRILNLGDTTGYGPDPEACIDLVAAACEVNLCGNHDYAVLHEPEGFNPVARVAVFYHQKRLRPDPAGAPAAMADRQRWWHWLEALEPLYEETGFEAMHASPRQPITEYVLPTDPETDPMKLADIFAAMGHPVAFVGHTHFPGILIEGDDFFHAPASFGYVYELPPEKTIVNVGSVGQPRDRDNRACYIIYDGKTVEYCRVPYDIEQTIEKVRACGGLHELCGLRLREGR